MVKMLAGEAGIGLAAQMRDGCDTVVASRQAYPEVRAALAAGRNHDLDPDSQAAAEQVRDESWSATRPLELTRAGRAAGWPGPTARSVPNGAPDTA